MYKAEPGFPQFLFSGCAIQRCLWFASLLEMDVHLVLGLLLMANFGQTSSGLTIPRAATNISTTPDRKELFSIYCTCNKPLLSVIQGTRASSPEIPENQTKSKQEFQRK